MLDEQKRFQALKARDSKAQGEGCEAAETLGERRRNEKALYGQNRSLCCPYGANIGPSKHPGLAPISANLCKFARSDFEYRMSNKEFRTAEVKKYFEIRHPLFDIRYFLALICEIHA
jgi:hypothetical protein